MPGKIDYLRDLRDNPQAMAAEVQARVKAATVNAVETAFRKYADAGLVEPDDSAPKRYMLTDKGLEELAKLEPEAQTAPVLENSPSPIPMFNLGVLLGQMVAFGEQARRLAKQTGIPGQSLSSPTTISSEEEPLKSQERLTRARALLARIQSENFVEDRSKVPWDDPRVQRLYGIELALSDLSRREVRERRDSLAEIVGDEVAGQISRLVHCEVGLCDEGAVWWSGPERVKAVECEVSELRNKLGFPAHVQSEDLPPIVEEED